MSENNDQSVILRIENLKKYFPIKRGLLQRTAAHIRAVDGVSLDIYKGETLGLVGESGCGKSTLGRTVVRLYEPTEGEIYFEGTNIADLSGPKLKEVRGRLQMIFQDPYSSLNPRLTIERTIGEPLLIHKVGSTMERRERVMSLLERVGLDSGMVSRFPHEFSGGQRQRIGIARALALNPSLVIADEPISALDVSIQAQVINLLAELQEEFGLTYLFIAHDLSMVRYFCDRVAVMYLGKIVEIAETEELFNNPQHPYTQALLSAVPVPDSRIERHRQRIILRGEVPSPASPPSGCNFNTRCPRAIDRCFSEEPHLEKLAKGHRTACFVAAKEAVLAN